jgi:hypothetical protein
VAAMINEEFMANVVKLILEGNVERAIELLSIEYKVDTPRIKIGRVKGKSGAVAVYVPTKKTIFIQKPDFYNDPHVILHEFYHHIRYYGGKHRGTEKYADEFAKKFILAYLKLYK